ncbi:MAG TPA: indolepyruvate oxidoreductase subunit beta family protein [Casimicrobiaceae bacterium]|nr:indolepyruvate oxidoreductase subunit beta family protein [Casimicrobiaceae bacterium]
MTPPLRPVRVLIAALGGQGGGVLAQWIVEAAMRAGYIAQSTSIPGVAQRTGATTYYVELFPVLVAELHGRRPVLSLYPTPGSIDLVIASELLEAARVMQAGMVSADCTHLVTSTSRTLTTAEKMQLGDGCFPSDRLLEVAKANSRAFMAFDMDEVAREAGTLVSAVMLGAIAGTRLLPMADEHFEAVIRESGTGVQASLRGFAAGRQACMAERRAEAHAERETRDVPPAHWPPHIAEVAALGEARMVEYQDSAYRELYRTRVSRVLEAERACDPSGAHAFALTREYARFLALWMAFDDIVRVAALKVSARRFVRVRREVNAAADDIVRIIDYFKPRIPEIAGLLPPHWAERVVRWDARRQARGREPLAFPVHLRSDGVLGLPMLRVLSSLRRLRRRGSRYIQEQQAIERWTEAIVSAAREDWSLANEIALCGRLIKGYGETNERGKRNLSHILEHLASGDESAALRAQAIRDARHAALADEGGNALDAALVRHGAPPRPVVAQPIRWMPSRRKPAATDVTT